MFHATSIDTKPALLHIAEYASALVILTQLVLLAASLA